MQIRVLKYKIFTVSAKSIKIWMTGKRGKILNLRKELERGVET